MGNLEPEQALVNLLTAFNRKERYWLLQEAHREHVKTLSSQFLCKLNNLKIEGLDSIPQDCWWGFDYHLDWIAVALSMIQQEPTNEFSKSSEFSTWTEKDANNCNFVDQIQLVRGSQQDADLLLAFKKTLIIVEAKGGTDWSKQQMGPKAERFKELHKLAGNAGVTLQVVLTSPKPPPLTFRQAAWWPDWARDPERAPFHVVLPFGEQGRPFFQPKRQSKSGPGERVLELKKTNVVSVDGKACLSR